MKTLCDDCCSPQVVDAEACACCEGVEILTPLAHYNRPGLTEIKYRIGTHGDFLQTMIARLTGFYFDQKDELGVSRRTYPLKALTTRNADDPSLALLDAWAMVADVLTFYQQRIANEGYLRTATERRSVLELSRLVAYKPRPGVAASVMLAYTLDDNFTAESIIPAGSRVQSIPGPDELPQAFESSEEIKARAQWNNLQPRLKQPQTRASIETAQKGVESQSLGVYLGGINTNIQSNDAIIIDYSDSAQPGFYFATEIIPDALLDHTLVRISEAISTDSFAPTSDNQLIARLIKPASLQPAHSTQLRQNLNDGFALAEQNFLQTGSNTNSTKKPASSYSVLQSFSPLLSQNLIKAVANNIVNNNKIKVYVLGIKASLFGHNMSLPQGGRCFPSGAIETTSEGLDTLALDAEYTNIKIGDHVALKIEGIQETIRTVGINDTIPLTIIGIKTITLGGIQDGNLSFYSTCPSITVQFSGAPSELSPGAIAAPVTANTTSTATVIEAIKIKVTVLTLSDDWRGVATENSVIKNTTVYIQNSMPELAQEPITTSVCGGGDEQEEIELDDFYDGLQAGRWVIVSGERDDLSGVRYSELAMLSSVVHGIGHEKATGTDFLGERPHTFIKFDTKLAYCFKRDSVTIYGNVVKATHGETRHEILGSGDGAKVFQAFELKQFPLTHISAANPNGIDSSLKLYVNNLRWHESDSLAGLKANARQLITKTDNEDKTRVIFGNGKKGARLPTGTENIRAEYRNGIGQPGNVSAEQISLLMSKPLGVKEVINPLSASGGADRETRDQARKHVPLAVKALDRLVSVKDYEDFSRIYAGIGKAYAIELSNGRQQLVYVTIAGANDIAIDEQSDLFRNLYQSLHDFGDPYQRIQLAIRELMLIVVDASIAILPDYQWEPVVTQVRERLLQVFSFAQRELGQDVVLSEIISVIQAVSGVAYVDINAFGGIPEKRDLTLGEIEMITNDGEKPLINKRQFLSPDDIVEQVYLIAQRIEPSNSDFTSQKTSGTVALRLVVNLPQYESKHSLDNKAIRPAQIAFMSPEIPATLLLNQIVRQP